MRPRTESPVDGLLRLALALVVVSVSVLSSASPIQASVLTERKPHDVTPQGGIVSPDLAERMQAIEMIMAFGDPQSVAGMLLGELDNPDPAVGLYIAQALGQVASPEMLPALRAALRHPNPDVRWRAALTLGVLGDPRAITPLARAMEDPEVLVQRTAADSLLQIGGTAAAGALVRSLDDPRSSAVNAAMKALQQMGETAVAPLQVALFAESTQARHNAATLLGYIASPKAVPALREAAQDPDPDVRAEVLWALGQIQG